MSPTLPFDPARTENPGPGSRPTSLDRQEGEGGPVAPQRRAPKGSVVTTSRPLSQREERDTAAGCRNRASADLLEAATLETVNERRRMESSAATWTVRAELLGRLEASSDARAAAAVARAEDESPLARS